MRVQRPCWRGVNRIASAMSWPVVDFFNGPTVTYINRPKCVAVPSSSSSSSVLYEHRQREHIRRTTYQSRQENGGRVHVCEG